MPVAYAALAFALNADSSRGTQLFPAGMFRARDGRPAGIEGWKMDAAIARRVMERAAARRTPLVIDYEHQTLNAAKNGQPAPAAGWLQGANLEWREGDGLYADVAWTKRALGYIDAKEYQFSSPVFSYDPKTGEVLEILHAAIVNDPGIDGMAAVSALATEYFSRPQGPTPQEDQSMKALAVLLGLAETATEEEINSAVVALKAKVTASENTIAALKTQTPDPALYVPVETVTNLQKEVVALTTRLNDGELDDVIQTALTSGKLLPAMESWARDLGKKDIAALKAYVEKNVVVVPNGNQTGGNEPGATTDKLDGADPMAVSRAALKYQTEQAAAGNTVNTVEAVNHVTKGA